MIIDFHTHAYPSAIAHHGVDYITSFYDINWQVESGTVARLRSCCAEAGVGGFVMHAVAVRPDQVASINKWLSGQLGDGAFGFGAVHPGYEDWEADLRSLRARGFSGAKFHPDMQHIAIDDRSMYPVYETASALGLPMMIHTGDPRHDESSPTRLARVLDDFPKLTAIAAHLGGYCRWQEAEQTLAGRKNVWYDTSSSIKFLLPEVARRIIRGHLAENIVFGTDYPITTQKEELERLFALRLTDAENEHILQTNAESLLGL